MMGDEQELYDRINTAYSELKYDLGWSFLYTPLRTLKRAKYPVCFFGLNPGGDNDYGASLSSEAGCAYRPEVEDWGRQNLQRQIVRLYSELAKRCFPDLSVKELMDNSLAANLVPFRSPSWESLPRNKEALAFSKELWRPFFKDSPAVVYFSMGKVTYQAIKSMLVDVGFEQTEERSAKIGWGNILYQVSRFKRGEQVVMVVRLPHLSRYQIFSSQKCQPAIDDIMSEIADTLRCWQVESVFP